jgi:hypothetical protein
VAFAANANASAQADFSSSFEALAGASRQSSFDLGQRGASGCFPGGHELRRLLEFIPLNVMHVRFDQHV